MSDGAIHLSKLNDSTKKSMFSLIDALAIVNGTFFYVSKSKYSSDPLTK